MNDLKHAEKQLQIASFKGPCVWVKCLPSVQAIVPHHSGSVLRSILKVHVFGQIIVNLGQFRVSCYKFDVKLKLKSFTQSPM